MTASTTSTDSARAERVRALDDSFVFHPWAAQGPRGALAIERGEGSYVWDVQGNRYLDFTGQLVFTNIGFSHPKVVAAIQEQAARLATLSPGYATEVRGEAARMIVELAGPSYSKVFFTNAGTEAVEHAVRMARQHTGRPKLLSAYRSYHGATSTSIALTGEPRRWANDAGTAGVAHFFGPYLYRSAFHATTEAEECQRALEHLEQVVALEGPSTIAAIVLESVVGSAGLLPPPAGYLRGVREICDRHGIVFIADEVMAGFGRTGRWFAFQHDDVVPDLITFAKGVNSGYVPLGGVIVAEPIVETFRSRPYPGGLTYSGHPLACAAAVATMTAMAEEGIVENAARIGADVLGPGLRGLAEKHPSVGEVRGRGVFWGVELVRDRASREPLVPYAARGAAAAPMAAIAKACRERGVLAMVAGNRIHVVPPCNVTDAEVREGLAAIDAALEGADALTA
ncbi:MAG TPA: aspartate aminotransferase family protein [Actinomycetes bacterium]|nr:aspartate aminotransferase family protein [Actinomycetes bacterium]